MQLSKSLLPLASLTLALSSPAFTQTITLDPSADGTLYEDDFGEIANGAGESAFVGDNSFGEIRRALLRFDTAFLPPGSTVATATLEFSVLQMSPSGPPSRPLSLHRVSGDWSEGASNAGFPGGSGTDSEPGDATWLHSSYPGSLWATPGGDFSPSASATTNITSVTRYQVSTPAMRDDVQAWLDNPSQSFGWALKMDNETSNSATRIATKESGNPALRPKLIIVLRSISYFCDPAEPNSTGQPTNLIAGLGFGVGSGLHLEVYDGPPNQFGYFLVGTGTNEPGLPLGSGRFCLATSSPNVFGRYNVSGGALNSIGLFDATGRLDNVVGTSTSGTGYDVPSTVPIPGNPTIMAGGLWHFQLWHREDNGDSNFSNGTTVQF